MKIQLVYNYLVNKCLTSYGNGFPETEEPTKKIDNSPWVSEFSKLRKLLLKLYMGSLIYK